MNDTLFEFYCEYHFCIYFQKKADLHLEFRLANQLAKDLTFLIIIYQQNLLYP